MVLPFALVIDVGRYLLLFVYATLFSLATQCVESAVPAPLPWLYGHGHSTVLCFALTSTNRLTLPLSRRLWDPGIRSTSNMTMAIASRRSTSSNIDRLLWDRSMLLHDADNATTLLAACRVMMARYFVLTMMPVTVTMQSLALRLRRQWDPGVDHSCYFDLPTSHSNVVVVTMVRITSVGWQSLFHYSHPVLSRPTVPNIDS